MVDLVRKPSLFEREIAGLVRDMEASADTTADAERLRYRKDPIAYLTEVLEIPRHTLVWSETAGYPGDHTWDGTKDPLAAVLEGLAAGSNVGVESGTGTGKTFLLAGIACWFLDCWPGSQVITVAPKEDQLKLHLWKELDARFWPILHRRYPLAKKGALSLKMNPPGEQWSIVGFVAGVGATEEAAQKAAGFHAPDMLFIVEETPGMKPAIMNAIMNTCTAPHNLRLCVGNPDHAHDPLHLFCAEPGVVSIRVSALDHPNVALDNPNIVPGAVSKVKVDERREMYTERGNLYLSRVRGISPAQAVDALIRRDWCEEAVERGRQLAIEVTGDPDSQVSDLVGWAPADLGAKLRALYPEADWQLALGVDAAQSKAGDLAAICRGIGPLTLEVEAFPCPDAGVLGEQIGIEIRDRSIDPDYVGVDSNGVGASTVNELKRENLPIQGLNAGAGPAFAIGEAEEFLNLRAEMHWLARLDLEHGHVCLPDDPELISDLCTPTWTPRAGKITVQKKEELRKLLGRSPNKGDAWVMWNWVRQIRGEQATMGGAVATF